MASMGNDWHCLGLWTRTTLIIGDHCLSTGWEWAIGNDSCIEVPSLSTRSTLDLLL